MISRLETLDVRLSAEGERLRIDAPKGALSHTLREQIVGSKKELLTHLRRSAGTTAYSRIPRRAEDQPASLSFAQERLWFLQLRQPESSVYNLCRALRITGTLDLRALETSLNDLVRRHDSLRTKFVTLDGRPLQMAGPADKFSLAPLDLRQFPAGTRDSEARRLIAGQMKQPFDLTQGRLLRVSLLRLRDNEYILALMTHHIAADAWSMGILVRELWALYEGYLSGKTLGLAGIPCRYSDYAVWQRERLGDVLRPDLDYWREKLADVSVLDLPADRARPATPSYRGGKVSIGLPEQLTAALNALSRREGATLFMTLLAAFQVLLHRWSGQRDIAVGAPIANRESSELEGIIGLFINAVTLRTDLSGAPTFRELLRRAREVCLGAYAHQAAPFELLVRELIPARGFDRHPLFQVMLVLQNTPSASAAPAGLTLDALEIDSDTAQFELSLYLRERGNRLIGYFEYATDLFDHATIERMADHFGRLLENLVADPDRSINTLPLLSSAEKRRLLIEWNDTEARYPEEASIQALFEAQCQRAPNAVALEWEDKRMNYRELNARANRLARELQELGAGPERIVGLLAERSLESVICILAILKAGAAYLPLDPDYPKQRLLFMLKDSRAEVLLTRKKIADDFPGYAGKIVFIDDLLRRPQGRAANLPARARSESAAYVIYTSGSTGTPKGVIAPQRGALNRFAWMWKTYPFARDEKSCQKTSLGFVDSVWEIFGALLQGIPTVLVSDAIARDPRRLVDQLASSGVTRLVVVPSLLKEILERCTDLSLRLARLKYCFSSGESLSSNLAERFHGELPACRLINLYGSSEVAGDVTSYEVGESNFNSPIPIGRPIANTQIYLLDEQRQLVPAGARGELYVGGDNLAHGYLRRPELTAERFIANPFSGEANSRLYRSGDLARYRSDGVLEFLGRRDQQIKVRGFRIEPGEIEAALRQHPAVRDAVVILRRDDANGASAHESGSLPEIERLTAYVVAQSSAPSSAELRSFLQEKLPDYMLPSAFIFVETLPRLPNGKIDRRALPPPGKATRQSETACTDPRTEIEALIAEVWRAVLKTEKLGMTDNFFELGGHSLLAAELAAKVSSACRRPVSLRDIFDAPTVALLAQKIELEFREPGHEALPPVRAAGAKRDLPLALGQEPLFLFSQLFGGGDFLNMPYAYRLTGKLDVPALQRTLDEIVRRHAVLRTGFGETTGGYRQFVRRSASLRIPFVDLARLAAQKKEIELEQISRQDAAQVFDLERPPLMRVKLLRLAEAEHVLLVTMHHIISDQWSMGVFRRELAVIYDAFSTGKPSPLPDLSIQFTDFACWQRELLNNGFFKRQISFWQAELGGPPAALEFRRVNGIKKPARFHSARRAFDFDAALFSRIKVFARAQHCTPFMVFVAALNILLHHYTGGTDIRIGTLVANRGYPGTDNLIGYFVNALVLRTQVRPDMTLIEVIHHVRETCVAAYLHQDLPFEHLESVLENKNGTQKSPLYQVMLNYRNQSSPTLEANGLTIASWDGKQRASDPGIAISRLDVNFHLRELSTKLTGAVNYKTDLFDDSAITKFLGAYTSILEQMVMRCDARVAAANIR